ncbi:hypothetical protein PHJA_001566800 [Phtheirospermum japonicum]|uniref:KIB1-4 beta-propeller domain-containing protein n=1 Tax=Phtheirospermum japonicum TaxID=374723 RepID=A0A830CDW5_9LAMI|nr:hypothetical protein PHJA_001566800 [Phtheirospermum japonicum]
MVYQFYSLGENRVLGFKKRPEEESMVDNNYNILGSCHGWLVLLNKHDCDMFLSNPLTGGHIKLPPIQALPDIPILIFDCSPDEKDGSCRVIIAYGERRNRLAFCCPGTSTEWTTLGDLSGYESCVYSSRQGLFFCCIKNYYGAHVVNHFEAWDLQDPLSPKKTIRLAVSMDHQDNNRHLLDRKKACGCFEFLVSTETSDEIFLVRRFVKHWMGPHGLDDSTPYTTVGFNVYRYDPETGSLKYMDGSLGGLALFVGSNNGFALSAAEFPELKPNSIYYTTPPQWSDCCGGHDVGIFNYQDQTFSPCFYPPDVESRKRVSGPMWFTPTRLVRSPFLVKNQDGSLSYAFSSSSNH